jgi:hypothetical protein
MPINALTGQVAGTPASLNALRSDIAVVEQYLRGKVDPSDFKDLVKRIHGIRGSVHRLYVENWSANVQARQASTVSNPNIDLLKLDTEALLDFTAYGDIDADFYNIPTNMFSIKNETAVTRFTWERLGNIPTSLQNGQGKRLDTNPNSWQNWLFNTPDPIIAIPAMGSYKDGREAAKRFPKDEYWDRWLTVPYACKRIYIPGPCVLYVTGNAVGTWGHNLSPFHEHDTDSGGTGGQRWTTGYDASNELPAFFRLFIDRDNDKEWRKFTWEVNGETFWANWSPIQDYQQVGYGGPGESPNNGKMLGREWSFTCAPRAQALVSSQIVVPEAGWYNISMRYNSRYFHGWINFEDPAYFWNEQFYLKGGTIGFRPGYIAFARWESSGLGIIAHFNRDSIESDDTGDEFGP